jgi:hypothetical protein
MTTNVIYKKKQDVKDRITSLEDNLAGALTLSIFVLISIVQIEKINFVDSKKKNIILYSLLLFSIVYLMIVTSKYGVEFYKNLGNNITLYEKITCNIYSFYSKLHC